MKEITRENLGKNLQEKFGKIVLLPNEIKPDDFWIQVAQEAINWVNSD